MKNKILKPKSKTKARALTAALLWIASLAASALWNFIVNRLNLNPETPLVVLTAWLSVGLLICLFFAAVTNVFKERLYHFYYVILGFIAFIWVLGIVWLVISAIK